MKPWYECLTKKGFIVLFVAISLLICLFTYVTRDVCYVGESGNVLGYGSCTKMIDKVINK